MNSYNRVVVSAPAKVNLSLDITGKAENGYHLLDTVMQSVDLCDLVVIGKRRDNELRVTCSDPSVPENSGNIAHKAALAFFAATGIPVRGLSVHIDKIIPTEAGLAGESTNAAAVLCGLDRLYETSLSPDRLREIGGAVGSDVPFCLMGGCARAQGTGDLLTPLPPLHNCFILIAKPHAGMGTRRAFELFDSLEIKPARPNTGGMVENIASGDLKGVGRCMFNVFKELDATGGTSALENAILHAGAFGAALSGSGSAVTGLFGDKDVAENCLRLIEKQVHGAWVVRPLDTGARVIYTS